MLGRNSQNKPNGFSIYVVLRSGAEIEKIQIADKNVKQEEPKKGTTRYTNFNIVTLTIIGSEECHLLHYSLLVFPVPTALGS